MQPAELLGDEGSDFKAWQPGFVLVYEPSTGNALSGCSSRAHVMLDALSLLGVLSGVGLLKELLGYRRILREEGKPDPAVRKGSKNMCSTLSSENCLLPVFSFR